MGGLFEMFGGGRHKASGPKKGKPKLIEVTVTLEEVYHGIMKTVKIKRYFNFNSELVFASLAMEREESQFKNAQNARDKEKLSSWFNLAQECTLKHRPTAPIAAERARR